MILAFLLFVFALLLPLALRLEVVHGDVLRELLVATLGLGGFVAAVLLLNRMRNAARPSREPRPAAVAKLDWPEMLSQAEMEAWCGVFLRQNGWEVATTQADDAGGVYLDATRPGARALLLCLPRHALVTTPDLRTLALSARLFHGARPTVLTMARVSHAAVQAAESLGVNVLQVADLPHLPERSAITPPPP